MFVSTSCHQLSSDHEPACMCHCIFFGINPRVSKHHAFRLHRATQTFTHPSAEVTSHRRPASVNEYTNFTPILASSVTKNIRSQRAVSFSSITRCKWDRVYFVNVYSMIGFECRHKQLPSVLVWGGGGL